MKTVRKSMITIFVILLTLLLSTTTAVGSVSAQDIPDMINYQGYLTDSNDNPINSTLSIRFSIYSTASGGSSLWQETQSSVAITDGLFNVLLGSVNPITTDYLTGTSYLGVKVGTDAEMTPRQRIVSSAYSLRSDSSNSAKQLAEDFVVASGENVTAGDVVAFHDGYIRKGYIASSNSTPYLVNQGRMPFVSMVALSENKFVIAYQDAGNSSYGTVIIGEVTGKDIVYGSEYIFSTSENGPISIAKLNENKIVIAFRRGTEGDGTAIIGEVTGNEIAFSAEYVFNSGYTDYISSTSLSESSFVIAFRDSANESYGTAIIGEITGTDTITYGSKYVFNTGVSNDISISPLTETKFTVVYIDDENSESGTGVIGIISGTDITFGSEYVFNSGDTSDLSATALSENSFVVAYRDDADENQGTAIVGEVSGADITFGSEIPFTSQAVSSILLDSLTTSKIAIACKDYGTTQKNISIIGNVSGSAITFGEEGIFAGDQETPLAVCALSSSKYVLVYEATGDPEPVDSSTRAVNTIIGEVIEGVTQEFPPRTITVGIAKESGSAGETVPVIIGGISDVHSGLTTGIVYYADESGNLSSTPNYNNVGFAISSSELILFGDRPRTNHQYFGDMIFANNFRITEASKYNGLILKNQAGQDIMSIDEEGNLTTAGVLETQGLSTSIRRVTQSFPIGEGDSVITCDASLSPFIVTLPSSSTVAGRQFTIKKTDATNNNIAVITKGVETIDGANAYTLNQQWKYITVISDGLNWLIIANN